MPNFWQSIINNAGAAKDAKVGAVGAEQVRQLYSEGKDDAAQNLAKIYTLANAAGIGTAAGANVYFSNPFIKLATDTYFAGDGIHNALSDNGVQKTFRLAKNGDYWGATKSAIGDVLDLSGTGDLIKIGSRIARPAYRALHAYDSISPYGYDRAFARFKGYAADLISNPKVNTELPKWRANFPVEGDLVWVRPYSAQPSRYVNARQDAWAIYNNLPQTYGTYDKVGDRTYRFSDDVNKSILENYNNIHAPRDVDSMFTHGGLSYDDLVFNPDGTTSWKTGDTWDLNPLEESGLRGDVSLKARIGKPTYSSPLADKLDRVGNRLRGESGGILEAGVEIPQEDFLALPKWDRIKFKTGDLLIKSARAIYNRPITNSLKYKLSESKPINWLSHKLAPLEIGPIVGGKPFKLQNEIKLNDDALKNLIDGGFTLKPRESLDLMMQKPLLFSPNVWHLK